MIATSLSSFFARSSITLENTSVQESFPLLKIGSPVWISNGPVPWKREGFSSAGRYPFPFFVSTWTSTGPFTLFASVNARHSAFRSCPSTGPKYLIPISSKNIPGTKSCLMLLLVRLICRTIFSPPNGILPSTFSTVSFRSV